MGHETCEGCAEMQGDGDHDDAHGRLVRIMLKKEIGHAMAENGPLEVEIQAFCMIFRDSSIEHGFRA